MTPVNQTDHEAQEACKRLRGHLNSVPPLTLVTVSALDLYRVLDYVDALLKYPMTVVHYPPPMTDEDHKKILDLIEQSTGGQLFTAPKPPEKPTNHD